MRSSSAVFGNPGDSRSGMVFRAVVRFMEAASKSVDVPLAFASDWRLSLCLYINIPRLRNVLPVNCVTSKGGGRPSVIKVKVHCITIRLAKTWCQFLML